jgi:DNA (cytosine-5)-methyltransferase 1
MHKTVSLFSGIGGLDLGFIQEGFDVIWANDNDSNTWDTYQYNHPTTTFDKRSIVNIPSTDIPSCDVIIGGPPCQSWSVAGSNRGAKDPRGKLFYEYLRVINDLRPKIFVAENVEGILRKTHQVEFQNIISSFRQLGYDVTYQKLNAAHYNVPQERVRVIIVGIRNDIQPIDKKFTYPIAHGSSPTLTDAIYDLRQCNIRNVKRTDIVNDIDAYLDDSWSSQFMSRNRVRSWDEASYTIPATGRQIPIHPQAPKMIKVTANEFKFDADTLLPHNGSHLYRRFTVHECARIQTFPDSYKLIFDRVDKGYKMLGNAVPVNLASAVARSITDILNGSPKIKVGLPNRNPNNSNPNNSNPTSNPKPNKPKKVTITLRV